MLFIEALKIFLILRKLSIVAEWEANSSDYIFKLYSGIPRRLLYVFDKKRNATKY